MDGIDGLINQLREYSAELDERCAPSESYLINRAACVIDALAEKLKLATNAVCVMSERLLKLEKECD